MKSVLAFLLADPQAAHEGEMKKGESKSATKTDPKKP